MSDSGPARTDLDAWLAGLRERGGSPGGFEKALLGVSASGPLPHGSLLELGMVGVEAFGRVADVPPASTPVFAGRAWRDLPSPGARTQDPSAPPRSGRPGQATAEYAEALTRHLLSWLQREGHEPTRSLLQAAKTYPVLLARADFRALVGWERTLDVHAACMVASERLSRPTGGRALTPDEEAAVFRWLHLATYDEVPEPYLKEQAARREVHRAHLPEPAAEVASLVCEVPFAEQLQLERQVEAAWAAEEDGPLMSLEQLASGMKGMAAGGHPDSAEWGARLRGFGHVGHLVLEPGADQGEPGYAAYAHGHLLRWWLDRGVPLHPRRMRRADYYSNQIVRRVVESAPAATGSEAFGKAHSVVLVMMFMVYGELPLAEDLLRLAWLADQGGIRIELGPYLARRNGLLARGARRATEKLTGG